MSTGRNLSLFSDTLITSIGILYLHTSLPLFYGAEMGCKEVLQNKQTFSTKKAVLRY